MCQKCLKNVSKMYQKCLKHVSKMSQKCFKNVSKMQGLQPKAPGEPRGDAAQLAACERQDIAETNSDS